MMFFSIKTLAQASILFALALVLPASNHSQQRAAQTQDPVQLHVTVTDKKDAFVNGLQRDNFEVVIDNKPATVVSFDSQDVPAAIGIVFDSSGSMSRTSLKQTRRDLLSLRESLKRFLALNNPSNEYFLIAFNEKPQLLVDWTSDHARLTDNFNNLTVYGNSAFYDACYLAVDKLQASQRAKRVLLVISDGQDNLSRYTFKELHELIKGSAVTIFSIFFTGRFHDGADLGEEAKGILEEFSELSGGAHYAKDGKPIPVKDMPSVFELVAAELRHQYSMSIVPDRAPGKASWSKIKVAVKSGVNEKTKTRTRKGFY